MADKPFTLVYYYIPEDFDDPQMPNAFAVQKQSDQITLTDIESTFPLPGDYIFRFRYKYANQNVWMDLANKKCKVPKADNRIFLKVTRKVPKYSVTSSAGQPQSQEMNSYLLENDLLDF